MWLEPPIFIIFRLHSYEFRLCLQTSRCCQNTCKMHVVQIPFCWLHKRFSISSILFFHINQHLMVAFNVFHKIQTFFPPLVAFISVVYNAYCWVATSCYSPKLFAWHATNYLGNALCFNVTSQSCISIMPISPYNASRACFVMSSYLVEDKMLASCANHLWLSIMSNDK
jgi:hypothetical protein